ncbi:uncharacterized protein TRIADDRAFT_61685 [Trichoplax adhaerens]|uniref:Protein kinase domain-containing protein n=1 Tax=Trichoplax adhaerens TaxID=10228 RepID=B3SBP1_TRIAD|nr:predicted protein [Trichoplax adhaerens]EDV19918.1 predicted protein [Trichoplax adhaerens]|eukprot:XP_002117660.1 predicted protein [Trichoplax adhaerens]
MLMDNDKNIKNFFPESLRNEKISIISTSSTTEIKYNFKLRLIDLSHKNCKLGWLKCYDRKDRNLWEKEKQFYYDIALRNWHISNIVECIWFEGGNKYKVQDGERFGAEIHNRLLICYALPGEDIGILSDLISSQSDFLTPESVIQIVKDIEVAFNSLKFHSIIYGNIHMDAIFIALLSQGKKITALLGDFSSTQIFDDAMPYPNFADLQMNDYSNMKQLCDALLAYCKFKILEDMTTTDNSLHINNVAISYSSSDWKTAQDWDLVYVNVDS